jgi:4-hydroxy-tetrahydrodipicolinate synthase
MEVLSGVSIPIIISTHSALGYLVPLGLIAKLLDRFDHVVGINCTTDDLGYLGSLIRLTRQRATVHVANIAQFLTSYCLGADGFLLSEANLCPNLARVLAAALDDADLEGAAAAYAQLLSLWQVLSRHGGIRATKAALGSLGLPGGVPRHPRLALDEGETAILLRELHDLGLGELDGLVPALVGADH